jgi:hypothetical protein
VTPPLVTRPEALEVIAWRTGAKPWGVWHLAAPRHRTRCGRRIPTPVTRLAQRPMVPADWKRCCPLCRLAILRTWRAQGERLAPWR